MEIATRLLITLGLLTAQCALGLAPTKAPSPPTNTASESSDPCRESILNLPLNATDVEPFLRVAACRLRHDRGASLASQLRLNRTSLSDSLLKTRLPKDGNWYLRHLVQFRSQRDSSQAMKMAYLTELKQLPDPNLYRELAEVYLILPDPFRAALAYLQVLERDTLQSGMVQYQLQNLMRSLTSETPAGPILDSLTSNFAPKHARTADVLETLCWENRNYSCAYQSFMFSLTLRNPGPAVILERANRLLTFGFFDNASVVLDKLAWRSLSQPWLSMARILHMQIRFQLKDWNSIATEFEVTDRILQKSLTEEEWFMIATAFLKLGQPVKTLNFLKPLEEKSTSPPWAFKARLLKAQTFLALSRVKEAAEVLTALKRDPKRLEGTGPILFWQGCLAVDQGRFAPAESLFVLASAYTGNEEAQRALEYRFYLMLDTGVSRRPFFQGLVESPRSGQYRLQTLDQVSQSSALWPHAQLEKAQILVQMGQPDSAEKVLDNAAKNSQDRLAGLQAEAKAAFLVEKFSGGRQAALARYEDLLIKYQQGVVPEFSRERIKALK